ncbi:MAG: Raf kinase inhibitor-like YbhB/YbcL family protein [Halobacteriales archaeon]|jgi:Raf kinase inhibitor-like YbhB/YbcL family protein
MVSRRDMLQTLTAASFVGLAGCSSNGSQNGSKTTENMPGGQTTNGNGDSSMTGTFAFTTSAFEDGGTVPVKYTCSGADVSPPFSIQGVPAEANSLAIVVDDPDAPSGVFTHWLIWNLPADTTSISENVTPTKTLDDLSGAHQGRNDFDEVGYRGPCPPTSHGAHTYRFKLFALDSTLDVDAGAKPGPVNDAIDDHRVARAQFTGIFNRG